MRTLLRSVGMLVLLAGSIMTYAQEGLKDVFKDDFKIGAAINGRQASGADEKAIEVLKQHFNSISPENDLKFQSIHPEQFRYNWGPADNYVALGEKLGMHMLGHTLVWHSQTGQWVFRDAEGNNVSRDTLLLRMRNHIHTVVGRYKGRIHEWDVVNEALNEDGTMRESLWYKIIGEDYIAKAFTYAREADPNAELNYNDYNLNRADKADGAVRIVKYLQDHGVKVDAIGMQMHYRLETPSIEEVEASILKFKALGVKVKVTELDLNLLTASPADIRRENPNATDEEIQKLLNPFADGPSEEYAQKVAQRWAEIFALLLKHRDVITRVTTWGIHDAMSWRNRRGPDGVRNGYALLFGWNYEEKPALTAVLNVGKTFPRK